MYQAIPSMENEMETTIMGSIGYILPIIVVSILFSIIPILPQYIPYNPNIINHGGGCALCGLP